MSLSKFFSFGEKKTNSVSGREILARNDNVKTLIKKRGFREVNIIGDGNCFYRAVSHLLFGSQTTHHEIRCAVANYIEKNGSILTSLLNETNINFQKYIKALMTSGNYDFIGEETSLAVADIYQCEVHIHSAYIDEQVYLPKSQVGTDTITDTIINLAFFEPNHFQALEPITLTQPSSLSRVNEVPLLGNDERVSGSCEPFPRN